jgi:hypothetical protein
LGNIFTSRVAVEPVTLNDPILLKLISTYFLSIIRKARSYALAMLYSFPSANLFAVASSAPLKNRNSDLFVGNFVGIMINYRFSGLFNRVFQTIKNIFFFPYFGK